MRIIFTKLRGLVFFIITLFKRALCCFKRRRRSSCDSVPLTHVGIVPDQGPIPNEPQEWTEWDHSSNPSQDPKTRTIQQQIEMYRQQTIAAHQVRDEPGGTNEEDLFNDMAPNITRQKKVFVSTSAQDKARGDRFALDPNVNVNFQGGELGEWDENSGWEDETLDVAAREALLERKRQQRERRAWEQQQKRQERSGRPAALGARLNA